METLKPLNVPVSFANYNQSANTYVVFLEYNQVSGLDADDEELRTSHSYQVDVFSKGNYDNLVKQLKVLLKKAGFRRIYESETYEDEMKMFRKILRFSFTTKEED